jgi:hypothetical protein
MNVPLSTRIQGYGQFFEVSGDFGDVFFIRINWDSKIMLYANNDEGMVFIRSYDSLPQLFQDQPGFSIISPQNANERYLPPLIAADKITKVRTVRERRYPE